MTERGRGAGTGNKIFKKYLCSIITEDKQELTLFVLLAKSDSKTLENATLFFFLEDLFQR